MDQIGARQVAFLSLCAGMVLVGTFGLAGRVSAGGGLFAANLIALTVVSFYSGVFYSRRLA